MFSVVVAHAGDVSLVIIDMQYGFYRDPGVENSQGVRALIRKQQELISWAKSKKIPVLIFEFATRGKTDRRILDQLKGHTHRIIKKTTDDGFSGMNASINDTLTTLKTWNAKHLIVSGINGGACVHDTIQGAGVYGFISHTTGEIVGDLSENPPIYPDSGWFYDHPNLKTYKTLADLIKKFR